MGSPLYIRGHTIPNICGIPIDHTNMIDNDKIELIKTTANDNMVDIIADFVSIKKRGAVYVGLSPFNNERTPSFTIHPSKGIFKDFSSGNGGDVIKFLMISQNWRYMDAIKYLALKFGIDIDNNDFVFVPIPKQTPEVRLPSFIHPNEVNETLVQYDQNSLYQYLCTKAKSEDVNKAFADYKIGTWKEWCIFWQIDINTFVRSGKWIKYQNDGHRDRSQDPSWYHKKYADFNLVQCFFGEHLINEDVRKPIAIVESEKTSVIASLFMPTYIWIASGSKYGINDLKCQCLNNKSVTLFPDLGCYNEWNEQAKKYGFSISNHIEKLANDEQRAKGLDLADFLLM